jgi:hypothetical protein
VKAVRWLLFLSAGKIVRHVQQTRLNICSEALKIFAIFREH